jgi:uncharacterized protein with gpF-like domain
MVSASLDFSCQARAAHRLKNEQERNEADEQYSSHQQALIGHIRRLETAQQIRVLPVLNTGQDHCLGAAPHDAPPSLFSAASLRGWISRWGR